MPEAVSTMSQRDPQRRAGLGVTIGFILSMLMAVAVALVSVWALREVTRTEADARHSALQLADVERLRLSLERRVASWREFMLARDDKSAAEIQRQTEEFQNLLAQLRESTHSAFSEDFEAVAKAERAYHEEIREALKLRGRTVAGLADAVDAAGERIRPLREAVEASLRQLSRNARDQIQRDVTRVEELEGIAFAVTVAAVGVLLVAGAFGLWLTRALRLAVIRERTLRTSAEALADEVAQQSKDVELRLREVSAELDALKAGRG